MSAVLLLNIDRTPLKVITWQHAVGLIVADKAEVLTAYPGRLVRSVSLALEFPAVVALKRYVRHRTKVKFSRRNVLARDRYTCAYCGAAPAGATGPDLAELTLDHIQPRSRGGATSWTNITTACYTCNSRKANRTPAEAGMVLRRPARRPGPWEALHIHLTRADIPQEWVEHLPAGSAWRGYWSAELER